MKVLPPRKYNSGTINEVSEAVGLVLVSPIYNYNVTALIKAFIDRLYCFYNFTNERPGPWSSQLADLGRKAVIIAVGEQTNPEEGGMDLALKAMRLPVEALGYEIIDEMPVLGIFHKGIVKKHPEKLEKAESMGRLLASSLSHIFK